MAYDFPNAPTTGQIYQPSGGPAWQFDGTAWKTLVGATGLRTPTRTVFTTVGSASYTIPAGCTAYDVEVLGGGAGGGATAGGSGVGTAVAGSGGGAGGYGKKLIQVTPAIRAATKTVVVSGGAASNTNGGVSSYTDGTNTIATTAASSGSQGSWTANAQQLIGGQAGSCTGGDINTGGGNGGDSQSLGSSNCGASTSAARGGKGGDSLYGSGGRGWIYTASASANFQNGTAAAGYGAGGGGAAAQNSAAQNVVGGVGTQGIVIITEYYTGDPVAFGAPPSDGNEYVMVNGLWRLKRQTFSLVGSGANITVPAGVKIARITGAIYAATQPSMPMLRMSADGSTFLSGASDYFVAGTTIVSGSGTSPTKQAYVASAQIALCPQTDNANVGMVFEVTLTVNKPAAPGLFTALTRGMSYGSSATLQLQEFLWMGYGNAAALQALTQLPAFQIIPFNGTWGPTSNVSVEWIY